MTQRTPPLTTLVHGFALTLMTGWLLYVGKDILLPIATAVLVVYVMTTTTDFLARVPMVRALPRIVHQGFVLLAFLLVVLALGYVIEGTVEELQTVMPVYQDNLEKLIENIPLLDDVNANTVWQDFFNATVERLDIQGFLVRVLGSITSFGAATLLVIVYAGFLASERISFSAKVAAAFPSGDQAAMTERIIRETNQRIGEYLAVKTLMNVVTGALSFGVLWAMDVDFALFYAVMLGLLNYIPYVGSFVGVLLPVVLSLAQFGSVATSATLGVLLLSVQFFTDNVLEPRVIGKQLNLSPIVVLVSLSVWSSLWGLAGAILAIPLTSMFIIIFDSFPATRFIAILLSDSTNRPSEIAPEKSEENAG